MHINKQKPILILILMLLYGQLHLDKKYKDILIKFIYFQNI
jgi:hypothetical protein